MASPLPGYASHFGIDNIPFGIASSTIHPEPQCVSRLGDDVIFLLDILEYLGDIEGLARETLSQRILNDFAALPRHIHQAVRKQLQCYFADNNSNKPATNGTTIAKKPHSAFEHISAVTMHLPVRCNDFSDFSCSSDHVENASEAMMGVRSHPPAFFYQPVGYAGRCSSLDVSGTPQERPLGQFWSGKPGDSEVIFGPSRRMDYELELACIVGKPVPRKERLMAKYAGEHIFGFVLVNDWSARDIQGFEMNPLGPLNGKNLGTNVSPWVITPDALEAFRTTSMPRRTNQPTPMYLSDSGHDALKVEMQVHVSSNSNGSKTLCKSNSACLYWTLEQCLAQQALAGCGLQTGDVVATGTVSGSSDEEHGCLMEFMKAGNTPPRGYLDDGETVILDAYCGNGVGFGECVGTLMPAKQ